MTAHKKPIVIVHGANKHFGPQQATSIDLYTKDCVTHSRFRDRTVVVCRALEEPFPGIKTASYESGKNRNATFDAIRETVARIDPALIINQQQTFVARNLAYHFPDVPVLLSNHNFVEPAKRWYSRISSGRRMRGLAGMTFVSEPCRTQFQADWPIFDAPTFIVPNGLDFADWTPAAEREKVILFAGRLVADKGVLELAQALQDVLPHHPDWTARFICNRANKSPDYAAQVRAALSALPDQTELRENQPFEVVKRNMERAAIVVVPSRWQEPFGRTALEAFAGGAALITSGTGGLAEIAGEDAIVNPDVSRSALAQEVRNLIQNDALRQSLSHRGRQRGETLFDIRAVSRRLDDICASYLPPE